MKFDRNMPRFKDPGFTGLIMIPGLVISYRDINYGNLYYFFPSCIVASCINFIAFMNAWFRIREVYARFLRNSGGKCQLNSRSLF